MRSFTSFFIAALLVAVSVISVVAASKNSDVNDVDVLQYALTLEHLESAFYNQGLTKFNTVAQYTSAGFDASVYGLLQMIQTHESSHVAFLTEAINTASPNAAVPACTYNFSAALSNVSTFLSTASVLENTGQTAYDGAINGLTNPAYQQVAASIATVEARHAAYLNEINGQVPFPLAFDPTNTPSVIAAAITPFLVSCPQPLDLPGVRPSGVALNASNVPVVTGTAAKAIYTQAQQKNDLTALNYALTLENLESAFYAYVMATFNSTQFINAGFPAYYYNYTQMIAAHEATHVLTLTTVINGRSPNAAVSACTYNFSSVSTIAQYLATAQVLENTGVMAYDGAVNTITDTSLQQVAATIATVEARHAAFLNQANSASPFPSNMDTPLNGTVIVANVLASGLVVSCPYNITVPVVIPANSAPINTASASLALFVAAIALFSL